MSLLLAGLACVLCSTTDVARVPQRWLYDRAISATARGASSEVAVVLIDEASQASQGPAPWSRDLHARLIDQLAKASVIVETEPFVGREGERALAELEHIHATIASDPTLVARHPELPALLERSENSLDGDTRLARSIERHRHTLLALAPLPPTAGSPRRAADRNPAGTPTPPGAPLAAPWPLSGLRDAAAGIGHTELGADDDDVLRRHELQRQVGAYRVSSVAVLAAGLHRGQTPAQVEAALQARPPRFGPRTLHTDDQGRIAPIWTAAPRQANADVTAISAQDVLAGKVPPGQIDGRVVVIGRDDPGMNAYRVRLPEGPSVTPAVALARMTSALLTSQWVRAPAWAARVPWLLLIGVAAYLLRGVPRMTTSSAVAVTAATCAVLAIFSHLLFRLTHVWISPVMPMAALVAGHFGLWLADQWQRSRRRRHHSPVLLEAPMADTVITTFDVLPVEHLDSRHATGLGTGTSRLSTIPPPEPELTATAATRLRARGTGDVSTVPVTPVATPEGSLPAQVAVSAPTPPVTAHEPADAPAVTPPAPEPHTPQHHTSTGAPIERAPLPNKTLPPSRLAYAPTQPLERASLTAAAPAPAPIPAPAQAPAPVVPDVTVDEEAAQRALEDTQPLRRTDVAEEPVAPPHRPYLATVPVTTRPPSPPLPPLPPLPPPPALSAPELPTAEPFRLSAAAPLQSGPVGGQNLPKLGPYQLERELGRGAMGRVYLARDTKTGLQVAVKTLALAREFDGYALQEARQRFHREALAASRLRHPDIVTVLATGEADGIAYIAMEHLGGHDLTHHLRAGTLLPVVTVVAVAARVSAALAHAHVQGVIHRDIKPANVMIDLATGRVKVTDFGIARVTGANRTRTGLILGSPSYMSPEQLAGREVDGRSDLYSLGVLMHQMLTGELPLSGNTMSDLISAIANTPAPDVRSLRPALPEALANVVSILLEKRPELRYRDGLDLAYDLKLLQTRLVARRLSEAPATTPGSVQEYAGGPFASTLPVSAHPPVTAQSAR